MTRRSGTIGGWMAAIALVGLAVRLGRWWAIEDDWLGEVGPMVLLGLLALAVACVAWGRARRFGLGLAGSSLVAAGLFLLAPTGFRIAVGERLVAPVAGQVTGWLPTTGGLTDREIKALWAETSGDFTFGAPPTSQWPINRDAPCRRGPFFGLADQIAVGLLELPIATLGGLFAARRLRPRTVSPSPAN